MIIRLGDIFYNMHQGRCQHPKGFSAKNCKGFYYPNTLWPASCVGWALPEPIFLFSIIKIRLKEVDLFAAII